ncbi:hypothetical protein [Burkholderia sp. MSMB1835]|uniref:hypothetical protein n=1 Tax=Burkholderia sp. MSMB1835 TaxID=1637876 RepID=UPI000B1D9D9D|nr:hypothetical protein [Burkholderia sp. MSMB1835]
MNKRNPVSDAIGTAVDSAVNQFGTLMKRDAQDKISQSPDKLIAQGVANGVNTVLGSKGGEPPLAGPGMAMVNSITSQAANAALGATDRTPPSNAILSNNGGGASSAESSGGKQQSSVTSPNAAMRENANATGTYTNPLTGETVPAEGTLAVDHVVPKKWIKQRPGFDQLTLEQQSSVLNDPVNTEGLPATFNSSKGAKMPGEWTTYKGQPLDPAYILSSSERAEVIRNYIDNKTKSFLNPPK